MPFEEFLQSFMRAWKGFARSPVPGNLKFKNLKLKIKIWCHFKHCLSGFAFKVFATAGGNWESIKNRAKTHFCWPQRPVLDKPFCEKGLPLWSNGQDTALRMTFLQTKSSTKLKSCSA